MKLQWTVCLLVTFLLVSLAYGPHTLHGETAPAAFPPQRVVSLTLAADEILLAIVPPERIAALTHLSDDSQYSNVVDEAQQIQHKVRADAEQVIALRPDLIIASTSGYTGVTARALLAETGIPLLELPWFDSFAGVQQNIRAVGQAVGATQRAHALVARMEQRLHAVEQQVAGRARPRVLYYFPGGFVAGKRTTMHEMITRAGGLNVCAAAGIHGVKQLSQEILMNLNPEIILVGGSRGAQEQDGLRAALLVDPTLRSLAAIRTGQVHVVSLAHVGSLSHHIAAGVEAVARIFHPQVFEVEGQRAHRN